jgi:rSAM/selenodomain-associated transferase 2
VPHVKIAVVIPALDEADQIAGAILSAKGSDTDPSDGPSRVSSAGRSTDPSESGIAAAEPASADRPAELRRASLGTMPTRDGPEIEASGPHVEVVVVDGGSRDDTPQLARRAGAQLISCEPGRARQLDVGWRSSDAEAVVFLHADTRLEAGWPAALAAALLDPSVAGGAFRLRFEGSGALLRALEFGVLLRVKLLGLPYGDQAIFVRRSTLESMGGIPSSELMEDLDLVAAIKSRGKLVEMSLHATTSPRRYLEHGALRTVGRHLLALAAWRLGVDRRRVAHWVHR